MSVARPPPPPNRANQSPFRFGDLELVARRAPAGVPLPGDRPIGLELRVERGGRRLVPPHGNPVVVEDRRVVVVHLDDEELGSTARALTEAIGGEVRRQAADVEAVVFGVAGLVEDDRERAAGGPRALGDEVIGTEVARSDLPLPGTGRLHLHADRALVTSDDVVPDTPRKAGAERRGGRERRSRRGGRAALGAQCDREAEAAEEERAESKPAPRLARSIGPCPSEGSHAFPDRATIADFAPRGRKAENPAPSGQRGSLGGSAGLDGALGP